MATYYIGAQAFGINSLAHVRPDNNKTYNGRPVSYIRKEYKNGRVRYIYADDAASNLGRVRAANATRAASGYNRRQASAEADRYNTSRTAANRRVSTSSAVRPHGPAGYDIWEEGRRDEQRRMAVKAQMNNPDVARKVEARNAEIRRGNTKRAAQIATEERINKIVNDSRKTIVKGRNFISELLDRASDFAKDAYGRVSSFAKTAWENVKQVGGKAIERGREFLKNAFGAVREFVTGEDAMRRSKEGKTAMERLQGRQDYQRTLPGMIGSARNAISDASQNIGRTVSETARNAGSAIGNAARNVGSAVSSAAESIGSGARSVANAATTTAFKALPNSTQQSALSAIKSDYDKAVSEYQRLLGDKNASDEDKNAARDRMYALQQTYNMYYNAHEADVFKD